jgi:hypothetical protein
MALLFCFAAAPQVRAHQGPPFPILVDQNTAGYSVSVWADPDIGEARFFVILESPSGNLPAESPHVSMWVEPVSGRLDRVDYETQQQPLRNQMQFGAEPYFDQRDMWHVGFVIEEANGQRGELTTTIESTPPGFGLWDLAIYLFPFLLLGVMWIVALRRRASMMDGSRKPTHQRTQGAPNEQVNRSGSTGPVEIGSSCL